MTLKNYLSVCFRLPICFLFLGLQAAEQTEEHGMKRKDGQEYVTEEITKRKAISSQEFLICIISSQTNVSLHWTV